MSETGTDARGNVWLRGLIMLIFAVLLNVGQWLMNLLALVQFCWLLFTGAPNPQLVRIGRSLARWLEQIGRFLSCDTEDRPFPWAAWPDAV
jgi:hypothetical protein